MDAEVHSLQGDLNFDGATVDATLDAARLTELWKKVKSLMIDGKWRTIEEVAIAVGAKSENSVAARIRDLRKSKFGAFTVDRRRRGDPGSGLFEYRVTKGELPGSSPGRAGGHVEPDGCRSGV